MTSHDKYKYEDLPRSNFNPSIVCRKSVGPIACLSGQQPVWCG